MIITTEWLLDYLSPRVPLPDLLAALPRVGLDVEATHVLERELASVVIGFVRRKRPLENTSDKFVCEVEVAPGETRQIVCASAHPIEVGWGVPVALTGTTLPTGVAIHDETFHGVLSQGMICLDGELGMIVPIGGRSTGLHVFHDEALLGKRLPEAIQISGALVHLKVYPNRPDCLGLIGIAREVAAVLDVTPSVKLVLPKAAWPSGGSKAAIPVEIADSTLCARYTCQVINGLKIEKSPPWLTSRLLATGSRPINNVVDITNYVLKEWGHPLHAFDLAKVREKVIVRRFNAGESLKILDGRTIPAPAQQPTNAQPNNAPLAIADAVAPMALAGIMGGEASSISDTTVNVLLEAAHFEPTNIRLSSRRLGVNTDAAYRFERGLDPNETLDAARNRATALLFSDAGAVSAGPVTDAYPTPVQRAVFSLPAERVSDYLGIPVTREQVVASLTKLGYDCSADLTRVEVPTRRVDVNDAVVMIEDVARVIGYDAIVGTPSAETPTAGATSALDRARQTARELLVANGFLELRGVPLEPASGSLNDTGNDVGFSQLSGTPIAVTNPLNADLAQVRRSLVPFLLNTAELNAKRRATTFRYFEIDKIFSRPVLTKTNSSAPEEHWALGVLLGGLANDVDWSSRHEVDLFDLKGAVESLGEALRVAKMVFVPAKLAGLVDGTAATILVNGTDVGIMGQIAPELLGPRKIQTSVFVAEIFLGKLTDLKEPTARFEPLPRFPGVFRDLSFVVKKDIPYSAIEQAIRSSAGSYLETVDCIDVFAGKSIAQHSRSIAVSLSFRAPDRTLSSEEITASVDQVIAKLAQEFGAELRSAAS